MFVFIVVEKSIMEKCKWVRAKSSFDFPFWGDKTQWMGHVPLLFTMHIGTISQFVFDPL